MPLSTLTARWVNEELQHKTPEWMEPIQKIADLAMAFDSSSDIPGGLAKIKAASEEVGLPQFGKGSLVSGKSKSSQPKSGFGSQLPKEKKKRKKKR